MHSQEQVRAFVTGSDQSFRSRPDSFISLESDGLPSEGEHGQAVEKEPASSTPLKDATPTNEINNVTESDQEEESVENGEQDTDQDVVDHETVSSVDESVENLGVILESSEC